MRLGTLSEFPLYYPANDCEYQTSQPWRLISPIPYDLIQTPGISKMFVPDTYFEKPHAIKNLFEKISTSLDRKMLDSNPPFHKPHARSSL